MAMAAVAAAIALAAVGGTMASAVPPICNDPETCGGPGSGPRTITVWHTLNVSKTAGSVTDGGSSGDVISCGSDCTRQVAVTQQCNDADCQDPVVQTVTLTATAPGSGWSANWGGCTSSSGTTCNVTMDQARNVSLSWTDIQNPTVTITAPADGIEVGSTVQVAASAGDNAGTVPRVEYLIDGVLRDTSTLAPSYATSLSTAAYAHGATLGITARAVDQSGRTSAVSATRTVTVDRQVALSLSTPAAGGYMAADPVTVGFTTDEDVPADGRKCRVNGGDRFTCASGDALPVTEGQNTYEVQVTDDVGNVATATRSFTVDRTDPTAQFIDGPYEGAIVGTTTVTIGFDSDDASPSTVACSVDGAAPGPCTTPSSHTLTGLANGTHTLSVTVTDAAGNARQITRTFAVSSVATGPGPGGGTSPGPETTPIGGVAFAPKVGVATRTRGGRTSFSKLTVSGVPAGTKVRLVCKGGKRKACPLRAKTFAVKSAKISIVNALKRRKLRAGAVVELRIVSPAGDVKVFSYKTRAGKKKPRLTVR